MKQEVSTIATCEQGWKGQTERLTTSNRCTNQYRRFIAVHAQRAVAINGDYISKGGRCWLGDPRRNQRCAEHFERNRNRMRHADFRAAGLCVGYDVVEAGCKTAIGTRLKRAGMHWPVAGTNAVLALRCCKLSGRYEDFWEYRLADSQGNLRNLTCTQEQSSTVCLSAKL